MKSFFTKFLLISLIYIAISMLISYAIPYHWGNPWFSTKIQFLEKDSQIEYNTFFFGSSRIYRHIDPKVFDSTFNSISEEKLYSFNLGAPSTFNPQCYYLYEKFLSSPLSSTAKYCFIELMEVDLLIDYYMHEERTSYWQNYSDILFVGKSVYANNQLGLKRKLKSGINYLTSFLENLLHLGHFGKQIVSENYYKDKYLGPLKNGFFSLDYESKTTKDPFMVEYFRERKKPILKKPELIDYRKAKILNSYNNISDTCDRVNLNRISELIQISRQKGIELIFILSPRYGNQKLLNLSRQLPEMNIIDVSNPQNYDLLYKYENSFDVGHLNSKGAGEYSKILAVELEKILDRTTINKQH